MMTERTPFWIVFPSLGVADMATQGVEAAYLDLEWLPFWSGLDSAAKISYLDRWDAPQQWRTEIADRFDHPDFDVEEDARDSTAWLAKHRN